MGAPAPHLIVGGILPEVEGVWPIRLDRWVFHGVLWLDECLFVGGGIAGCNMSVRIGLGVGTYAFANADAFWRWIQYCEENRVDSLWQSDRLISDYPHLEAMSVMAALAGATKRIRFGMSAVTLPYRDPLVLAKQCATIDFLSNGRLLPVFGVGAATDAEWQSTGREPKGRGRRADEILTLLSRLYKEDSVTFDGEFYQYTDVKISPRPVQKNMPLWIGGHSDAAIRRTARLGTGWLGGLVSPERSGEVIAGIKTQLAENGRQIDDDHYGVTVGLRIGSRDDPPVARFMERIKNRRQEAFDPFTCLAVGTSAEVVATFERYVAAGVSKFVAVPLADSDEEVFYQTQALMEEVAPQIEDRQKH